LVVVGLVVAGLLAPSAAARAQTPPETSTSLPPSTVTTSAPPTSIPTDPTETTVPTEPTGSTTSTTTAEDPVVVEAPPETVPLETYTIPERTGHYADQGDFASHPGRMVRVDSRTARARATETQALLDQAVARRDLLARRQSELSEELARLAVEERSAIEALEAAQVQLERRAASAYVRGNTGSMGLLLSASDATDYFHGIELLNAVVNADEDAVVAYQDARAAVDEGQAAVASRLAGATRRLAAAEEAVVAAELEHEIASVELAVYLAGGSVVIHGFVFPVAGPTEFIDSFGFPRMPGTEYEHWHEGTDIMTPAGTELVACERGVITRMNTNVLGGIALWLRGESGVSYYYAHLSGYAPGVREGMLVEAATVLGYAGNTGNARGTPPHLHFEVHPPGGVVNPYPLLAVAVDQEQPAPIHLDPSGNPIDGPTPVQVPDP
jgi:murein DD-endopeptidase MepM/ murein hydrolase activator NlpD